MYTSFDYISNCEEGTETITFIQNLQSNYNVTTSACSYIALKIKHFLSRYRQKTKHEFYSKVKIGKIGISNNIISNIFKESTFEKVFEHFSDEFHVDEVAQSQRKKPNQTKKSHTVPERKCCESLQIQNQSKQIQCGSEQNVCDSYKLEVDSFGLDNSVENLDFDEVMDESVDKVPNNTVTGTLDFENNSNKENPLLANKDLQTPTNSIQLGYEDKLFNLQVDIRPNLTLIDLKEMIAKKCCLPSLDFDLFYCDNNLDENTLLENVTSIREKTKLLIQKRNLPFESYDERSDNMKNNSKRRKCLSIDGTTMDCSVAGEQTLNDFENPYEQMNLTTKDDDDTINEDDEKTDNVILKRVETVSKKVDFINNQLQTSNAYLSSLTSELSSISPDVKHIKVTVNHLVGVSSNGYIATSSFEENSEVLSLLPIKDIPSFLQVEASLNEESARVSLIKYFMGIGGNGLEDAVRSCMRRSLSKDFAKLINWTGRKSGNSTIKKMRIEGTQFIVCLNVAAKQSYQATEAKVGEIVRNWLKNYGASGNEYDYINIDSESVIPATYNSCTPNSSNANGV